MLLLDSVSDVLQVVTGTGVSTITVHVSWVDNAAGTITPASDSLAITTAATTTIVPSPAASTQRNVKNVSITNNNSTTASLVTVQHNDGMQTSDIMGVTLLPGENLIMDETGHWTHHDYQGGDYIYAGPPTVNLGATGTLAETMPRETCPEVNTTMPASGTLFLQAIYLKAGQLVSNITIASATTAVATPTNQFYALYDANRNLLAQSANQTTAAWAANTVRTLAMTTPYRVPVSGLYYIGYLMVATTICTIKGGAARTGGQLGSAAPIIAGASTTGLTSTLPNPAAAITANGTISIYASVS